MALSEAEYETLAYPELRRLIDALDALGDDNLECELSADILSLTFPEDDAEYVINSHRAARQIWMAAERNAWHFDWVADKRQWIARKSDDELWSTIEGVLSRKLGRQVELNRGEA